MRLIKKKSGLFMGKNINDKWILFQSRKNLFSICKILNFKDFLLIDTLKEYQPITGSGQSKNLFILSTTEFDKESYLDNYQFLLKINWKV